jgi:hypothetical protein
MEIEKKREILSINMMPLFHIKLQPWQSQSLGPYSQHFMFFVTCKQTQYAGVLVPAKPLQLSVV